MRTIETVWTWGVFVLCCVLCCVLQARSRGTRAHGHARAAQTDTTITHIRRLTHTTQLSAFQKATPDRERGPSGMRHTAGLSAPPHEDGALARQSSRPRGGALSRVSSSVAERASDSASLAARSTALPTAAMGRVL